MTPRIARIIGYVILFASFPFMGAGMCLTDVAGGLLSMALLIVGGGLLAASAVWCLRKVRCPHCNALLPLKLYDIRVCPYCKKSTE